MKRGILYTIMFLLSIPIYGQGGVCGSRLNLLELQQTDPARYQRILDMESQIQEYLNNPATRSTLQTTITIPVVVHIVYNTSSQNISDEQVHSQIEVLNEDFNRLNADKTNTPGAFAGVAGSANIRFFLAKKDPYGNATTGITRKYTYQNPFPIGDDNIKYSYRGGVDAWDTSRYLNIWVCNLGGLSNGGLKGYAQFPDLSSNTATDGVVLNYQCFGREGSSLDSRYNKGRTTTHEVGHWLGLRHIWGDDDEDDGSCPSNDCCWGDDEVDDTPEQGTRNYDCPTTFPLKDNCNSFWGNMYMNYMDYTDDACMNLFTQGQVERMRAVFDLLRHDISFYSHCYNGELDGDETEIDCGGSCGSCTVIPSICSNGVQDEDETGIDCGGTCPDICGIGGKLNEVVEVISNCITKRDPIPVGNVPSLFSGENIVNTENIKLSHGLFEIYNNGPIARLFGGFFFEQEGYQFSPYKTYKITLNFNPNTYNAPLHFAFAKGLVELSYPELWTYIDLNNNRYYISACNGGNHVNPDPFYCKTTNIHIPMVDNFYIGNLTRVKGGCSHGHSEVTFTVRPDDYYKQLWIYTNTDKYHNDKHVFNSLKIEEECLPDSLTINNGNISCGERTMIASEQLIIEDLDYPPSCLVKEFIAGNEIIINENVIIESHNQVPINFWIDSNIDICSNNTPQSVSLTKALQTMNSTSSEAEENSLSNEINELNGSFTVYPNPTNTGRITIASYSFKQIERVQVIAQTGAILIDIPDVNDSSTNIDLSRLLPGTYILKIFSDTKAVTQTIIKQ